MRKPVIETCIFTVCTLCSISVAAESLYQIETSAINATTLFDQTLTEPGLVAVKPQANTDAVGDVDILQQCLWSVAVDFNQSPVLFSPGKMVCIGPNQEVLESIPEGEIVPFGQCSGLECSSYNVAGQQRVIIDLTGPLEFTLQPRNERQ